MRTTPRSSPASVERAFASTGAALAFRAGVLHGKMSSLDYLDLCRLCLVKDHVSVPIFEGEGDVRQIFLKITACLPVKVDREDKLPKKICDDCVYKVELFYQFWNTTVNAEKQLLQWLGEVGLEEKPDYVTSVLNQNVMKPDPSDGNRLDGSMMQQVSGHQNNMGMGMMENINLNMPMMMPASNQQQMTSVPMDTSGSSVQTVQEMPGTSDQSMHEQITQSQTSTSNQQEEEEESSEEENSEDECDGEEGLPVKEESEEDPNNSRAIEPTTFVNVSLACDEAGPSGLQQQKIAEMPEMAMPQNTDGDPKSGQRRKKSRGIHECIKCRAPFYHMRKLVEHLKNLHGIERAFNCDECGKAFRSPMNITRHKLIHTGEKKFTCDLCDYTSNQKSNLEFHKRRHRKEYIYKCEKCEKGFVGRTEYMEHVNVHAKDKFYRCEYCEKSYPYKKNLTAHLRRHHGNLSRSKNIRNPITSKRLIDRESSTIKVPPKKAEIASKYLCDLCGKTLSSQKRLAIHRRGHTGEKVANCEMCAKRFSSKENLKIHMRTHTGEKPYACSKCGRRFTQRTSLVIHLRYHSGERPFQCTNCEKSFISGTFLKNHSMVHHKDSVGKSSDNAALKLNDLSICLKDFTLAKYEANEKVCELCEQKFHFVTRLVAHLRIVHGIHRPFKCTICEKNYPQQFMLNAHVKKCHTPKTVACGQCTFTGVDNNDVERHKRRHHRETKFTCEICSEIFTEKVALATHTTMHNFMEYHQCNACGETFNDVYSLKEHNRLYHYDPTSVMADEKHEQSDRQNPEHKCEICGKVYKYKSMLKQHKVKAHGDASGYERRRYLCALCGKELKTAKGLEIHNRSHTGEKPYTCEICGKCFACETLLRTHNVTHTGERKYSCDQCGKAFTQRSTLVVHKRYHTGERPYVCSQCGKGFVTRTVLNTHMKSCR